MKKLITTLSLSLSLGLSAATSDTMSAEVASCQGKNGFNKPVEISVYRSLSNTNASILVKDLSAPAVAYQNLLFTDAAPLRVGNIFVVKHPKIYIEIDLASEKADKTMKGIWDDKIALRCKIITPAVM